MRRMTFLYVLALEGACAILLLSGTACKQLGRSGCFSKIVFLLFNAVAI
jgi:hypothetical protein